jgi:hypothetical protein
MRIDITQSTSEAFEKMKENEESSPKNKKSKGRSSRQG